MSADVGHAQRSLELARELLERSDPVTLGLWPRAAALLGRQALEDAISWVWLVHAPGIEVCSMRAQLLCLSEYLGDERLAEMATHVHGRLSWACHHHPYELAPTANELRGWLEHVAVVLHSTATIARRQSGEE